MCGCCRDSDYRRLLVAAAAQFSRRCSAQSIYIAAQGRIHFISGIAGNRTAQRLDFTVAYQYDSFV